MYGFVRSFVVCALAALLLPIMAVGLVAQPPDHPQGKTARLVTYDKADGQTYFALGLSPADGVAAGGARDIVLVFDTSASQVGVYRQDALGALEAMLNALPDGDRVKLVAADLRAVPLTKEFVPPRSPAMQEALAKLNRRVPLGSTDMRVVLEGSADEFDNGHGNPKALVYIGDGMSKADLLATRDFQALVERLTANQIPVSAFAVGPRRDIQLLSILANLTGGNTVVDANGFSPQQAGGGLARIAHAEVTWPKHAELPAAMTQVYPQPVPPLRSDRDTILVGKLDARGEQEIQISGTTAGKQVELSWTVSPERSSEDQAYLPQLVDLAANNNGATLPTAGSAGLREVRRVLNGATGNLADLSGQALSSGDVNGARRLADAALARDPNDPLAKAVRTAAGRGGGEAPLRVGGGSGAGSLLAEFEAEAGIGDFLKKVNDQKQVQTEILQAEVETGLSTARDNFDVNPAKAQQDLKLLLEQIERAPDVESETRAQLRDQVVAAIQEARRRDVENSERDQLRLEAEAAAKERQRIVEQLGRRELAIKQIMDRFNALMDERRFREAQEASESIRELMPDTVITRAAVEKSRFEGFWRDVMLLNEVRQKAWVDTTYQIERSAVPFPGDPPITYPDPEVWEGLTLRRKKFASIDLAKQGGAEEKILNALEEPTTLEFIETPLQDVIDYLKDLHSIEIQVDNRALEDVGIGSDTPITRNLKGITLRSALRLMLKELDLTYVIQDEVLSITTPEEAESQLLTKVYPVADLVLPISAGVGANPFSMGGGLGGGGGFGGGMGGMGGGMGGGMMGGMGGGMGGGFGGGMGGMGGGGMFRVDDRLIIGRVKSR